MKNLPYQKWTNEVSWHDVTIRIFFFEFFFFVTYGLNISGSKNSSLEASSGNVLNADLSLFALS